MNINIYDKDIYCFSLLAFYIITQSSGYVSPAPLTQALNNEPNIAVSDVDIDVLPTHL